MNFSHFMIIIKVNDNKKEFLMTVHCAGALPFSFVRAATTEKKCVTHICTCTLLPSVYRINGMLLCAV